MRERFAVVILVILSVVTVAQLAYLRHDTQSFTNRSTIDMPPPICVEFSKPLDGGGTVKLTVCKLPTETFPEFSTRAAEAWAALCKALEQ